MATFPASPTTPLDIRTWAEGVRDEILWLINHIQAQTQRYIPHRDQSPLRKQFADHVIRLQTQCDALYRQIGECVHRINTLLHQAEEKKEKRKMQENPEVDIAGRPSSEWSPEMLNKLQNLEAGLRSDLHEMETASEVLRQCTTALTEVVKVFKDLLGLWDKWNRGTDNYRG